MKINWDRVERWVVYTSLIAGVLSAVVSGISSELGDIIPPSLPTSLFGLALIGALHFLMKRVEAQKGNDPDWYENASFIGAMQGWVGGYSQVREMRLVAFTTAAFYEFIQYEALEISRLRILLCYIEGSPSCAGTSFEREKVLGQWRGLVDEGKIGRVEISVVPLQTSLYYGLIGEERAVMGLLWPNPNLEDLKARKAFVFPLDVNPAVARHLRDWFESMWDCGDSVLDYSLKK